MKNLPLALQIWLVFTAISLCISIVLAVLFPLALRGFFTREIFATIEHAQNLLLNSEEPSAEAWRRNISQEKGGPPQSLRTVDHFFVFAGDLSVSPTPLPPDFLEQIRINTRQQEKPVAHYTSRIENRHLFYVIRRTGFQGREAFLVSYMWDRYRNNLVSTLFRQLFFIMFIVFLFSWIPSLLLARYLSRPLVALEQRVNSLTARRWDEPVSLQRRDEIGRLGQSIEKLRHQLIRQDEAQQNFLHHVSHQLKTPVMVIRSFTQSIRDGIFPRGDLHSTLQVIDEESERLEKRIRNLLYLNKLDYLAGHSLRQEDVPLDTLISDIVERFRWRRGDLEWSVSLVPVTVEGDGEQLRIALENILDNQVRCAGSRVTVTLDSDSRRVQLHIWNDGPQIGPEVMDKLFQKFYTGYNGEFGLGLAIVQRIAALHNGSVSARNEYSGVSFYLEIPHKGCLSG